MSKWMGLILVLASAWVRADVTTHRGSRLPDVEPPPLSEAQWVATQMRVNGLPMTLRSFRSRLSAEEVLRHYERWARGRTAHETYRIRNGQWQILAVRNGTSFITIQARPSATGSIGTITVSEELSNARVDIGTRFPLPPLVHIANVQQYEDAGIRAEHIALLSPRAPPAAATTFRALLEREGWQIVHAGPTQGTNGGYLLEAQKDVEHAQLTFLPHRQRGDSTAIVIVWRMR